MCSNILIICFIFILIILIIIYNKNIDNWVNLKNIQDIPVNFSFIKNSYIPSSIPILPKCLGKKQCV